jgi:hypothetical protein
MSSESKASSLRLVTKNWRKRLSRQDQNGKRVGSRSVPMRDGTHHSRRVIDADFTQALEFLLINRVSPMHPTTVVSEPQGTGMVQGVEELGKSEGPTVMVGIGPRKRSYPA